MAGCYIKAEGLITAEDSLDSLISTEMKRKAHERRQKSRQPECSAAIQDPSREYEVPRQSMSVRPDQHTDCRRLH